MTSTKYAKASLRQQPKLWSKFSSVSLCLQIPVYATIKETLDPLLGRRDGIEINYMKFLAFNGPYKLFHTIWVGPLGAHDADW